MKEWNKPKISDLSVCMTQKNSYPCNQPKPGIECNKAHSKCAYWIEGGNNGNQNQGWCNYDLTQPPGGGGFPDTSTLNF